MLSCSHRRSLESVNFSFCRFLVWVSLFFNLFPWVSFSLNSFDMQPWVIFFNSLVVLLLINKRVHSYVLISYMLWGGVLFLSILDGSSYSYRALASYFILFLTLHFFYLVYVYYPSVFVSAVLIANVVWVFFGFFQLIFGVDSLSFLVRARLSLDRGVASLAPEPTHFGFHLVFLSWLILLLSNLRVLSLKVMLFFIILNFMAIVFLAKSSMAFLYFLFLVVFYFFAKSSGIKGFLIFLGFCFFFIATGFFYVDNYADSRLAVILSGFVSDPLLVVQQDASINARFSHLFLSLYGSVDDFFYPHGFSSFYEHSYYLNKSAGSFFWYNYQSNIIMSGLGALLYELGFIGLFFLFSTLVFMMGWAGFSRFGFFSFLLLWVFMCGAIPISYPMLPAVIVLVYLITANRGLI